jgi:hypothetical protein
VKAEFARARQVLRKAVRRARARFRIDLIRNLNCNPKHCPGQTFDVIRKLQSISSSQDSGTNLKKSVMRLKNPLTVAGWCAVQLVSRLEYKIRAVDLQLMGVFLTLGGRKIALFGRR